MGAKEKLNAAHLNGAFLVAGLLGLATESVAVFGVSLVAFVAASWLGGSIRS